MTSTAVLEPEHPKAVSEKLRETELPEKLRLSLERMNQLRQLHKDWDGYGAPSIPEEVMMEAYRFLSHPIVYDHVAGIFPGAAPGIQFEFRTDAGDELEIEIYRDRRGKPVLGYILERKDGRIEEQEGVSMEEMLNLLYELFATRFR